VIAARLHGREDLRVEEVPDPEPGPGEVKIAVAHNGLCGTDLHEYFDGPMACTNEPHPLTGGRLPQIVGHEFAGTVAAARVRVAIRRRRRRPVWDVLSMRDEPSPHAYEVSCRVRAR